MLVAPRLSCSEAYAILPDQGLNPCLLHWQADFFFFKPLSHQGSPDYGGFLFSFSHFSAFISEEGNGNPLQYSRLENPMDGGAWEAAVHGVAKSQI